MIISQGTTNTTIEESGCLTIVTSPLNSSSPQTQENLALISFTSKTDTSFEK